MKLFMTFFIGLLLCTTSYAMDPINDFLTNKGVGESTLRVLRSLNAPNDEAIEHEVPVAIEFSAVRGITGGPSSYLVYQRFHYSDVKSGSVAALISYDIQGNTTSVKVIAAE